MKKSLIVPIISIALLYWASVAQSNERFSYRSLSINLGVQFTNGTLADSEAIGNTLIMTVKTLHHDRVRIAIFPWTLDNFLDRCQNCRVSFGRRFLPDGPSTTLSVFDNDNLILRMGRQTRRHDAVTKDIRIYPGSIVQNCEIGDRYRPVSVVLRSKKYSFDAFPGKPIILKMEGAAYRFELIGAKSLIKEGMSNKLQDSPLPIHRPDIELSQDQPTFVADWVLSVRTVRN